jgi:SAM-dependent methyltransferase
MGHPSGARVSRYILDGTDPDLKRLLSIAERSAELASRVLGRAGVSAGWAAIDCGCGPIGALAVLAEMVGPAGRVLGVDVSPAAVQRARAIMAALELANVEVVAGDLYDLDATTLGGPFDVAYTRLFMTYQADPVRALRHIASLLRPGGWIVIQEPLPSPTPAMYPTSGLIADGWNLFFEVVHRAGIPEGVIEGLPRSAREAGLEVAAMSGFFTVDDGELWVELLADTVTAARERGIQLGIAAERFDGIVQGLRAQAAKGEDLWSSSGFGLELELRKPVSA